MSAKEKERLIREQQSYLDFVCAEQPYRRVTVADRANARAELAQLRIKAAEYDRIKELIDPNAAWGDVYDQIVNLLHDDNLNVIIKLMGNMLYRQTAPGP